MQSSESFQAADWEKSMVGSSRAMSQVKELIRLVGARKVTVLITGETGTGKEVVAKALHKESQRRHKPLISVNCAAIPSTLLEAELFGHTRGAFTGATAARRGFLEAANHGTIFLDEIGEMPLELQAKLLRFLQDQEIQRLGSSESVRLDVRVIAATNSDLLTAVRQNRFRQDLYYRLNVVPIKLPALRHRLEDLDDLSNHFVRKICRAESLSERTLDDDVLPHLRSHSWPGNVRELEHSIERAVTLSGDRRVLYARDFIFEEAIPGTLEAESGVMLTIPEGGIDFESTMAAFQRQLFAQAMKKCAGNKQRTADLLGLKRTTLISKFKALEIDAA